jgi:ubiquinone/menaquinone biosynthesis C-methylase UbiE
MEKYDLIVRISKLYDEGANIVQYLKSIDKRNVNSTEDILISYDFQAGSYIRYAEENPVYINNYTQAISNIVTGLLAKGSVLEVGVGEATTMANVARKLGAGFIFAGFDISWSRIFYAKKYMSKLDVAASLFTSDLFRMPFANNSIDLIYSSHSLEPNGGREEEALKELYRVASNYIVLLEPAVEFASPEGKERMRKNGYITNLKNTIEDLGYNLIEYRKFEYSSNPLNPTALYVIEKNPIIDHKPIELVCPISHSPLIEGSDHFFSPVAFVSYPKIMGIPCLVTSNAVLTTKMP